MAVTVTVHWIVEQTYELIAAAHGDNCWRLFRRIASQQLAGIPAWSDYDVGVACVMQPNRIAPS